MADDNLPSGTVSDAAPKTDGELIDGLADLLDDDPETDPVGEDKAKPATEIDDDPDGLNEIEAEDVDADGGDDPDGSEPEIKGGRFAPDSAKVTLDDGSVITVADLKRNNLFQRDYTKKTTELSAEREQINALKSEVDQYAQQLNANREYLAWYAEQHAPKPPEPFKGSPQDDPLGYMQWTQARDQWAAHQQAYQVFQQQRAFEEQQRQGETQKQRAERLRAEAAVIQEAYPILRDPVKGKAFLDATERDAGKYFNLTQNDLTLVSENSRYFQVLRDAIAYRRAKEAAPKAQQEVAKRRPVQPGKRQAPSAQANREKQVLTERLRKSGSLDDGAALLSRFNL